jgi:hypothetical protein
LRDHHLHTKARRQQLAQPVGGATKSFEAPFVNDLWMVDFSPCAPQGQPLNINSHFGDNPGRVILL